MGEVISPRADVARIEEHIRRAFRIASARGGEVAQAASARLGSVIAAIDSARQVRASTEEAEELAWSNVIAVDAKSDAAIGRIRDEMWNALGRPKPSPQLDQVFPEGVSTYTSGDPRNQPLLMQVLSSRILSATAPQWAEEMRKAWASEIDALRASYATAVEAHRPLEAAAAVALATYRSAVRTGQARLAALKRDFKNQGLSEAQIHEIIPDAHRPESSATVTPPDGPPAGGGGAATG